MKCQVVTVANRVPDRSREGYYRFDMFLKSLARHNVAPTVLGMNEWWGGLMTKPRRLREWLRAGHCTAEILIVCDAFDIVFVDPPEQSGEAFLKTWPSAPIVFNAERGIFPRGELAHKFDDIPGPWKYLNSGFFIGTPAHILAMLEAMWLDDIVDDVKASDALHGGAGRWINPNDQGWYQLMYAAQPVPIQIDERCSIAQCLSACTLDEFDLEGPRIRNRVKNTRPGVWHFNGGSKNDLMPVFLKHWGLE